MQRISLEATFQRKVYLVMLHPNIPFITGDTEGHDHLCRHYTAQISAVKQLCRVCECPTHLSAGYSKQGNVLQQ